MYMKRNKSGNVVDIEMTMYEEWIGSGWSEEPNNKNQRMENTVPKTNRHRQNQQADGWSDGQV